MVTNQDQGKILSAQVAQLQLENKSERITNKSKEYVFSQIFNNLFNIILIKKAKKTITLVKLTIQQIELLAVSCNKNLYLHHIFH